ncbi:MAG TPA: hypothetical protein VFL98_00300 [Candidatus Paceibacterota bacterium]|nr:hypothetical protein [Candidatus Paceibacterota bacterium]
MYCIFRKKKGLKGIAVQSAVDVYVFAAMILKDDFISPEAVMRARSLAYSDGQREALARSLPSPDEIAWYRANDMLLMPGPPRAMSLIEIRALNPDYFYFDVMLMGAGREHAWYDEEPFARSERAGASGWIAFSTAALPDSFERTHEAEEANSVRPLMAFNVAEVAWVLSTYRAVRGTSLLEGTDILTASRHSNGRSVFVRSLPLLMSIICYRDKSSPPLRNPADSRQYMA